MPPSELGCPPIRLAHRSVEDDAWRKLACLIHCKRTRELRPQECHKRAAGSPEDVELHKRSAEASGFGHSTAALMVGLAQELMERPLVAKRTFTEKLTSENANKRYCSVAERTRSPQTARAWEPTHMR